MNKKNSDSYIYTDVMSVNLNRYRERFPKRIIKELESLDLEQIDRLIEQYSSNLLVHYSYCLELNDFALWIGTVEKPASICVTSFKFFKNQTDYREAFGSLARILNSALNELGYTSTIHPPLRYYSYFPFLEN